MANIADPDKTALYDCLHSYLYWSVGTKVLKTNRYVFKGDTSVKIVLAPCQQRSTLKENDLFTFGANSTLSFNVPFFQKGVDS